MTMIATTPIARRRTFVGLGGGVIAAALTASVGVAAGERRKLSLRGEGATLVSKR